MPLNLGNVSTSRLSFGPAVVYIGAAGATPSTDLGLIKHDSGVKISFNSEMAAIMGGNPATLIQSYAREQTVTIEFTAMELNSNTLLWGLGTGATATSSGHEFFRFGGDPCPDEVALLIQHQKCTAAQTVNYRIWKAQSDGGSTEVTMGADAHEFPLKFKAVRSTTSWAGTALAANSQLIELDIES